MLKLRLSGKLWRHRDFQRLWLSDTVSQFGNQVTSLALPTVAILLFKVTPFQLGILLALGLVSFPILGLFVGVWVDRMRRRPIMVVCNFGRMAVLASIPVAFVFHVLTLYQLYAVAALNGTFTVFFDVAYQSYLPVLVERSDLIEGNQKLQTSQAAASVFGPPLAGFIITLFGAARSIIVDAAGYLVSAFSLTSIKKREEKPERRSRLGAGGEEEVVKGEGKRAKRSTFFSEMKEGILVVTKNPILSRIAGCTGTSNLGSSIFGAVYLLFAYNVLHLSPFLVGVIGAPGGLAFVIGVIAVGWISRKLGVGRTLLFSTATSFAFLGFPLAMLGQPVVVLATLTFIASFGTPIYNIVQVSLRQAITPDIVQGRMNATMRTIVWGTLPAGSLIGGALGTYLGVVYTLAIGAAISGLAFLWILLGPVIKLKEQPTQVGVEDKKQAEKALADSFSSAGKIEGVLGEPREN